MYNKSMDLSIIIISYNTEKITKKCLDTICDSLSTDPKLKAEIIVLDNASTDGSLKMLHNYANKHKDLKVIASRKNLGFGPGNNEAAGQASGEYLLFLNSDTEALEDAVPQLYNQFLTSGYSFAGAKLLNKDLTNQPSVGRFYTPLVAFAALFLFADYYHFTRFSPNRNQKADWVSGACFITKATDYKDLQGFDPEIFMYFEEVDLFYRAHLNGLTTGFLHEPTFIHLEGASSKSRTQPILKVYEGYIHFYRKHYSPLHLKLIQYMLQLKAIIALTLGKVTKDSYLIDTYTQAYEIAQKN